MSTGISNSSEDYGGNKMGLTPASDKASKMLDKEAVPEGLKKNSMKDREPASPGGKKMSDKVTKNGFNKGARGK